MRVNVYAEELSGKVELVSKTTAEGTFTGVRFWLELPVTVTEQMQEKHGCMRELPIGQPLAGPFLHKNKDDNDSSAVTFWGKTKLRAMLQEALQLLEAHAQTGD